MTTHDHALWWLRADAPYAPFVQAGLLACIRGTDDDATTRWDVEASGLTYTCMLRTRLALDEVANAVVQAPWPDLSMLPWPSGYGQAIKPVLAKTDDQVAVWRSLTGSAQSVLVSPRDAEAAAAQHVSALLTDGVLDKSGAPGRSRLLRGVKADLSGVNAIKLEADSLADELSNGPRWSPSGAGSGLGLVPEVQTYGGVTGPKPDSIKASSALLYSLIVHALATLPPFGVLRGSRRSVGGSLVGDAGALVWPIHTTERGLRALLGIFGANAQGDGAGAPPPGVACRYRSAPRAVNSMISMFPWGELIT